MNIFDATRKHYNAAGVHPTTDPDNPRSQFAVDRYENHLRKLIKLGMRALDLGCNAGRFTFAMEDMGVIATGIRHYIGLIVCPCSSIFGYPIGTFLLKTRNK